MLSKLYAEIFPGISTRSRKLKRLCIHKASEEDKKVGKKISLAGN